MRNIFIMSLLVVLTACGTVSGFGSDIKGAADWTREKMGGGVDLNNGQK